LHPEAARAHAVLGVIAQQFDWDWDAAQYHFSRAIALNPNDATAHQWKAEAHCYRREFELCRAHMAEALALDPLSPILIVGQGLPDRFAFNFEQARDFYENMVQRYPDFPYARFQLGLSYAGLDRWDVAGEIYESLMPIYGIKVMGPSLAQSYARTGRMDEARGIYDELLKLRRTEYVSPLSLGGIRFAFGDEQGMYDWLDIAISERDENVVFLRVLPYWNGLTCNPRFDERLRQVDMPDCEV
jgi:serine/threonine-protein kinase